MNKVTKYLLHQFKLHVSGAPCRPFADGLYRRAAVHRCADLWLSDMGTINASIVTDVDGMACVEVYKEALAKQLENGDYWAALLLAIRAFPLMKRFDDTFTVRVVLADIIVSAWKKGKDPYSKRYVNFFELRESVKRFARRCGYRIDEIVNGKYVGSGTPQLPSNLSEDVLFIILVSLFAEDFC